MNLTGFVTSLVLGLGLSSSLSIPGNLGTTNNLIALNWWFWETPPIQKAFCFAVPDRVFQPTDYIYKTIYGAEREDAQKKVGSGATFYHSGVCQYEGRSFIELEHQEPYSPNDN